MITYSLDKKRSTPEKPVYNLRGPAADLLEGAVVNVSTKSGKTRTATVGRVYWTGADSSTGEQIALAEQLQVGGKTNAAAGCGVCGAACAACSASRAPALGDDPIPF